MESGSAGIQSRCIIIFLIVRYGMGGAHVSFFFERQNDAVFFLPLSRMDYKLPFQTLNTH
jgi:hypothetical protein